MEYSINFSEEKNELLRALRRVCFDDVLEAIQEDRIIGYIKHFKPSKYPNQFLLFVEINGYIYVVPYVKNDKKMELYLKTIYPSRKLTKIYKGLKDEKEK